MDKLENNQPINKLNRSKRKRLRRKVKFSKNMCIKMFGNNVDGIVKKLEAIENLIISELPSVLLFQ